MRRALVAVLVALTLAEATGVVAWYWPESSPLTTGRSLPRNCPPGCLRCTDCSSPIVLVTVTRSAHVVPRTPLVTIDSARPTVVVIRKIPHIPKRVSA